MLSKGGKVPQTPILVNRSGGLSEINPVGAPAAEGEKVPVNPENLDDSKEQERSQ